MRNIFIVVFLLLICKCNAQCFVTATEQKGQYIPELTGILTWDAYPCQEEVCPPCLTLVLLTKQQTYYLIGTKAEEFTFPEGEYMLKVVVSGVADYNGSFYWLKAEDIRISDEPITTNIQTIGYVQNENGEKLQNIRIIVHTTDRSISDTVYSQTDGMFVSTIRDIDYSIKSMEVTIEDPTGIYESETVANITYTYECGVNFNPETSVAFNMPPLLFSLRKKNQNSHFTSLCDRWNVLAHSMSAGPQYEFFRTYHYRLTTDTLINKTSYLSLEEDGQYKGAMREENNSRIYFIPAGSTHEYLLYAFDAKAGDTFTNVWFGGSALQFPNGNKVTIREVQETIPKTFLLDVEYTYEGLGDTLTWTLYQWIEGVGLTNAPSGSVCPFDCAGGPAMSVLCAYKNGEQFYSSVLSEELGCEYNYDSTKQSVNDINTHTRPRKILRDGILLIEHNGHVFNAQGTELK